MNKNDDKDVQNTLNKIFSLNSNFKLLISLAKMNELLKQFQKDDKWEKQKHL